MAPAKTPSERLRLPAGQKDLFDVIEVDLER
jgi:hypothetical protein